MSVIVYGNDKRLVNLWQSQLNTQAVAIGDKISFEKYIQGNKVDFAFIKSDAIYEMKILLSMFPNIKIIALSSNLTIQEYLKLFQLGIFGYLSIYTNKNILNYAFKSSSKIAPPSIISKAISSFMTNNQVDKEVLDTLLSFERFDNLQKNILFLTLNYKTDAQICQILNISSEEYYKQLKSSIKIFGSNGRVDFIKFITGER